jgi:DNA-binding NarL/FixJ family response regulator
MSAHSDASIGVLICDDNESMRNVLRDVIGLQPDVILLDLAMPHRTGLGALPELVQVAPEARIIVLSSLARASVGQAVIELGAALYLEKGASPDEINDAIEAVASPPTQATPRAGLAFATGAQES